MTYQWNIRHLTAVEQETQQQLERELNISSAAARMLVVRGIQTADEARAFVRPSLDNLHDPFLMKDMDKAVERLHQAITQGEKILIYGDYDVDGTTAVALMYRFLKGIGNRTAMPIGNRSTDDNSIPDTRYPIPAIDYYIPDRYTEGYGVSTQGIDYAAEQGCTLIITLDCGIKAVEKIAYANNKGIDVIVCDHHTPGDELPNAVAVLNMKRDDCPYPYKDLSGCGVGFKLAQAYTQKYLIPISDNQYPITEATLLPLTQLLAMSIASDIVPITGENRILAHFGIKQINQAPFAGISAVVDVAGIEAKKLTINELVYKLGPRINACGRMKSGRAAVELLLTNDATFARQQAEEVNQHNEERRDCDTETTKEALTMLEEDATFAQRHSTVVYAPHWHKGVVGIVASRLTETYYRPTIVLTAGEDGIISGSARSVGGFDIYAAIDSCIDLLTNFGGHKYAAGLSMHIDNLPAFCERFEHYVATHIREDQLQPTLHVEAELDLADITPAFYNVIRYLEPFGPGNPRPLFASRNLINHRDTRVVGKMGEHLRLDVTDRAYAITGIAFGRADMAEYIQNGNPVDICYELDENTFNHRTTIQMMVQDIKPS
ncbi:MAG: single-stranded-DNA-specific exonuclease RecJ [Paludibacteraceae bacterium]|nr:single-stranded-DNA-specific exonuclease RecJ [Paludibacteraceae bacterium]